MEKKTARVITGWRQVARRKPAPLLLRASAIPPTALDPAAIAEGSAKERWDGEGGQLPPKTRQ